MIMLICLIAGVGIMIVGIAVIIGLDTLTKKQFDNPHQSTNADGQ